MVADVYGTLLQELGAILQLPNLQPDANNTCLIKFKGGVSVQLELDRSGQFLVVGTDLDVISGGRYRETLFTEALKANSMPYPQYGIFAYSKQANHLVMFEMLNLHDLTGQKIADFLQPFIEKAKIWKEAISKEEVPIAVSVQATTHSPLTGMFGLRP